MSKIDFSAKAEVLSSGRYDDYVDAFTSAMRISRGYAPFDYSQYQTLDDAEYRLSWLKLYFPDEYSECVRLYDAKKHRAKRLNKRVRQLLTGDCVFCTLTFTDDVLERTSPETRHHYVLLWLKANFPCSLANIDFGTQNGREHYHALVSSESVDCKSWKYGIVNFERVWNRGETTPEKLAHYISKLTNHAIKATTKGNRCIYSGDVRDIVKKYKFVKREKYYTVRCHCPLPVKAKVNRSSNCSDDYIDLDNISPEVRSTLEDIFG